MRNKGRILNSQELIELLYVAYNREQYDIYDFETYLSESGYQSLYSVSEDVLNKRMKAIDEEIVRKAKQKAVYAYELASDEVRKKASAIQEKENKMQEYINNLAKEIVENEKEAIGNQMAKITKEKIDQISNKEKEENEKVINEKKKVKKLTEEERKRRLEIRRRKLMKEREKNGIIQKEKDNKQSNE